MNTQEYGRRPYGVGFLVIGGDKTGPHLYEFSPSGNSYEYYAISIGARSQSAKTYLEKHYEKFMDCAFSLSLSGLVLTQDSIRQPRGAYSTRPPRAARDASTGQGADHQQHLHRYHWPRWRPREERPTSRPIPHPRRRADRRVSENHDSEGCTRRRSGGASGCRRSTCCCSSWRRRRTDGGLIPCTVYTQKCCMIFLRLSSSLFSGSSFICLSESVLRWNGRQPYNELGLDS